MSSSVILWTVARQAPLRVILQARTLEWVAMSSGVSSGPGIEPRLPWLLHCRPILLPLGHQGGLLSLLVCKMPTNNENLSLPYAIRLLIYF